MNVIIALGVSTAFMLAGFCFAAGMKLFGRLQKPITEHSEEPISAQDETLKEYLAKYGYVASPGSPDIEKQWAEFNNYNGGV